MNLSLFIRQMVFGPANKLNIIGTQICQWHSRCSAVHLFIPLVNNKMLYILCSGHNSDSLQSPVFQGSHAPASISSCPGPPVSRFWVIKSSMLTPVELSSSPVFLFWASGVFLSLFLEGGFIFSATESERVKGET